MDLTLYHTVSDCDLAIKTLQSLGAPVPQELLDHRANLLHLQQNPQQENIYDYFARTIPYSPELKDCIESTVDKLMEDGPDATHPGLLLGKIQCGKTRAFVGIVGLAFDRGFDACVVLTKGTNALADQTVFRLQKDFKHFLGIGNTQGKYAVEIYDIATLNNGLSSAQIEGQKNVIVCMKQHTNLQNLIDLFTKKSPELKNKKILIVDDEADFVSHNFRMANKKVAVGRVTTLIDEFIRTPGYCRYLQVTATPYSLYLQPDHTVNVSNGSVVPFRPRFTSLVPIHANYIGGEKYFVESRDLNSMYSHLFHSVSEECCARLLAKNKDKRLCDGVATTPKFTDLRWAFMSYIVGSAIRKIQVFEAEARNYLTSFLVHISTNCKDHRWECQLFERLLLVWSSNIQQVQPLFDKVFDDMDEAIQKGINTGLLSIQRPTKQQVWDKVSDLLTHHKYIVQPVNSEINVVNLLDDTGQLRLTHDLNIFVGGFVLDRGITIDHMLGFMYGRNPKVAQQDTVLQHCRMYGNRSKEDMAVTRFHTTPRLYNMVERMDRMDDQLREWFLNYSKTNAQVDPAAVFIHMSDKKDIIPCGKAKLVISNVTTLKPFKRITTYGFQTISATEMKPVMAQLDQLITSQPGYVQDDVFEIDVDQAIRILKLIRSTYTYKRAVDNNADYEWNEDEMIGCIRYATQHTNGKMLCLHRTGRNMSRIRTNGNFVDAPEDGNRDTPLARAKAIDKPVLMLFRQNGTEAQGWRGAPFYWPSVMMPSNLIPAIFETKSL